MGTYLAVGIVPKIVINKSSIKSSDLTLDLILEQLNKELKIDCYNFSEDLKKYCWEIKPNILEGNLVEFLDEQFKAYMPQKDEYLEEVIAQLNKIKDFAQIMKLASSKSLAHFQLLNQILGYIKVVHINGFSEYVEVFYSLIAYFLDGKIIMECYENLLRYLEYNIRLQRNKYPIVDCVKVMITS